MVWTLLVLGVVIGAVLAVVQRLMSRGQNFQNSVATEVATLFQTVETPVQVGLSICEDVDAPVVVHRYEKQPLLTGAELRVYLELRNSGPSHLVVCPKVRLADVIRSADLSDRSAFNRVSQKHLDFVVMNHETGEVVAAIEVNDRSHLRPRRQERDAFVAEALASAGVRLVPVLSATQVNPVQIWAEVVGSVSAVAAA